MKEKAFKPWQIISTLLTYFGYYFIGSTIVGMIFAAILIVLGYTESEALASITPIVIFFEITTFIAIFAVCFSVIKADIKKGISLKFFISLVKYYVIMFISNLALVGIILLLTGETQSNNQELLQASVAENAGYMFFTIVIFAPVVEELVFRGAIYRAMRQKVGVILSILISSGSFALMHFLVTFMTGDLSDLAFLPTYLVPGIVMGLLYEETDSIIAPIWLHFSNNLFAFLVMIATANATI